MAYDYFIYWPELDAYSRAQRDARYGTVWLWVEKEEATSWPRAHAEAIIAEYWQLDRTRLTVMHRSEVFA